MTSVTYLSQGYTKLIMADWLPASGPQFGETWAANNENPGPKIRKTIKHPGPHIQDDCEASWLKLRTILEHPGPKTKEVVQGYW